jgi:hypothetical protein
MGNSAVWTTLAARQFRTFPACRSAPIHEGIKVLEIWPGRTNGGSTAKLSIGANQGSLFQDPTALPLSRAAHAQRFAATRLRRPPQTASGHHPKRSEALSSVWILSVEASVSSANFPSVPRRSISRLSREEASLPVLSKKGSSFPIARISFCESNHSSSSFSAGMSVWERKPSASKADWVGRQN